MRSYQVVALLFGTVFLSPCMSISQSLAPAPFDKPVLVGELGDSRLKEASGIAPSRMRDDILWVVNDGGNGPLVFATDLTGKAVSAVLLKGAKNKDWEDMASFVLARRPFLLIADVGDNNAKRSTCDLYIVEEPDIRRLRGSGPAERIDWNRIRFVYEDGPRDCESVAVDTENMRVFLLTKRERIPSLYSLPLYLSGSDRTMTAKRVGQVPHIPLPTARELLGPPIYGAYSSQPTSMDFDSSGRFAVVLTYKRAYWFPRTDAETWEEALSKPPLRINIPLLPQSEAICFSRDDSDLFLTSEKRPAPLYRIPLNNEAFSKANTSERSEQSNGIQKSDF